MALSHLRSMARFLRRISLAFAIGSAGVSPVFAGDGPPPPAQTAPDSAAPVPPSPELASPELVRPEGPQERAKLLDDLFAQLANAPTLSEAEPIKARIRQLWRDSGSPTVDLLLMRDVQAALAKDDDTRGRLLEAVTHLAPDNVEGWNRRAEFDYSSQRYGEAFADLGHVLAIEPRHFDALEGFASLLKETGHNDLALKAFRQLKAIDPTSANLGAEIDDLARMVEGQKI
jgi:tetratricopeptide (TPR) repeat protein